MALNSLCYGKQAWHPVWSHSKLPYCSSHLSNRISKANLKGQYLDIHHCRVLKIVQKIFHLTIFVTVEIFDTIVRRRELSYRIIRLQNFPEKIYFETGTFFDLTWKCDTISKMTGSFVAVKHCLPHDGLKWEAFYAKVHLSFWMKIYF